MHSGWSKVSGWQAWLHGRYNFFACKQILPDNLKAMPAEEASSGQAFSFLTTKQV
jgi:hypothetical protein